MKNLKDYILQLDNWIPHNILKTSLEELKKDKTWEQHKYQNFQDASDTYVKNGSKELNICWGEKLTYLEELMKLTWKAIEKYIITDKIGGDTINSWNGFSKIRFNRYKKNQIMSKHVDHIHDLFNGETKGIPILSIVAVLNDDYKGGEFIMFDDYEIKFKAGDLIIFPSIFLYPHLVKPIKKGTRYSFVSWCY
jgi:hypothetical protein|tara:strand:+ start:83 stop:661 length:579 start_codon:yes stop_codon:yes gene_type:complete